MLATQRLTVRTSHAEFRVLMTLAMHADRIGPSAWPAINTIADEAQTDRKTVWRSLVSLQKLGLISSDDSRNRGKVTVWTLTFMPSAVGTTSGATPLVHAQTSGLTPLVAVTTSNPTSGLTPLVGGQTSGLTPQTSGVAPPKPSKKESKEEGSLRSPTRKRVRESTKATASSTVPSTENGFETFWESYPRKVGKGAARKAYASAIGRGADPVEVLSAIGLQRWSPEVQFRPHASTWLNADRWLDDPEAAAPLPAPPGPSAAMLRIQQRDHDLLIIAGRIPGNDDDLFIPNMQTRFLQ